MSLLISSRTAWKCCSNTSSIIEMAGSRPNFLIKYSHAGHGFCSAIYTSFPLLNFIRLVHKHLRRQSHNVAARMLGNKILAVGKNLPAAASRTFATPNFKIYQMLELDEGVCHCSISLFGLAMFNTLLLIASPCKDFLCMFSCAELRLAQRDNTCLSYFPAIRILYRSTCI